MCGIVAILSGGEPVRHDLLERGLDAIRHRGPDGRGVWVSGDGSVGLAHVRLAIIDRERGAQPIASEDGTVQIVVSGELYEHERIRSDLTARGHRFRTGSDSEIALHLYEEYGVDLLAHLRGEFALVLWDAKNRQLLAARDRFGVKPLCWARIGGALALASEAKALFALGAAARWDPAAFFHAAAIQYAPPDRTLFEGVRQLEPGHLIRAVDGAVSVRRYWDLDYPSEDRIDARMTEPEAVAALRTELEESVRLRLVADVPIAFQLSGGLDSSAVVTLAARLSGSRLDCFTVGFEEAAWDELPIAEEMAAKAGATLHALRPSAADLAACLGDAVWFSEGLAANAHLPAKYLLHRAIRDAGFKVVLTGEGSDELLAGYAHLRRDLLLAESRRSEAARSDLAEALARLEGTNVASSGLMLGAAGGPPLPAIDRRLGFVPSWLEAKVALGGRTATVLSDDFKAAFSGRDVHQLALDAIDVPRQLAGRHPLHQSTYLWIKYALAGYILRTLGDGTEMASSVEGRVPFLDHRLFELARRLPVSLAIKGGIEKHVLREAVRPLVSEAVFRREKHPFVAPPIFSGAARLFVEDTLRSRALDRVPFLDRARIASLLDRLDRMTEKERIAIDPVVNIALTACLLAERFRL